MESPDLPPLLDRVRVHICTHMHEVNYGEQAETTYGLPGGTAFRIIFRVPIPYLDEYEDVFNDIAMTFDLTD